jgi:hypothetical protein
MADNQGGAGGLAALMEKAAIAYGKCGMPKNCAV